MTRMLDTGEYVSILKELAEEGREVSLKVAGGSMLPFLVHDRDRICFEEPKRKLKKGDMVFYQRANGRYIMHRIYKITKDGYYMVGDAQKEIEGPLPESCIFALITKVRRKGKWIGPEDFWWRFFANVWIRVVPLRETILKIYAFMKKCQGK